MTEISDHRSWWTDVEHLRPGADAKAARPAPASAVAVVERDDTPVDEHEVTSKRASTAGDERVRRTGAEGPRRSRHDEDHPAPSSRPAPRRGRIAGREINPSPTGREDRPSPTGDQDRPSPTGRESRPSSSGRVETLRRADAAAFADAMDLDGAFGSPVAPRSREIVLGRGGARTHDADDIATGEYDADPLDDAGDYAHDRDRDHADATHHEADGRGRDVVRRQPAPAPGRQDHPARRTVRISGSPGLHAGFADRRALREIEPSRARAAVERAVHRPDRIAMWVVALGVFLVLIAATSSAGVS